MGAKLGVGLGMVVLGVMLAGCGGSDGQQEPVKPTESTTAAPQPSAPVPITHSEAPYQFGDVQAKAPPIVDGRAPVIRRIPTDKPYVFITIDDGEIKDPNALSLITQSGFRPTMFLAQKFVAGEAAYFRDIRDQTGADIEDHTVNHPNLRGKPYAFQRKEICDDADAEAAEFGRRPVLFRPPYGNWDTNTQKAAADCGMRAVVLWTAAVNNGVVQFQEGDHLKAGDIVLMHFRTTFVQDYTAFVERARRDGLTAVPLPDFLG
ncbi:MAG TPA: polysaccharide deacetylase family protein [Actinophytocola sp.]|uniref:polysaccharide deacetylase family protein n=1 Tax=Actinophytocola sp. TaxID=1872138 RepID=UPI002DFBADF2|nr:polysaccharide deacetylase family protein [Actinophytocola sp.]